MVNKLEIINNIRRLCFFAGEMTRLEMAEKAGISWQSVVTWGAGKYIHWLEIAFKIAAVFGVGVGDVFECKADADA